MPLPPQPHTRIKQNHSYLCVIVITPHFTRHLALALALYIPLND